MPDPHCPSTRRHGTPTAMRWDRCRCPAARAADSRAAKTRELARRSNGPRIVDACGTRRRLQALMAIGWSQTAQADWLGATPKHVNRLAGRDHAGPPEWVNTRTRDHIAAMYAALSHTPPPASPGKVRTVRTAAAAGYVPPIGWDDDDLDNPDAHPWPGIDDRGRRVYAPPTGWDGADADAVRALNDRLKNADPGLSRATRRARAYRAYFEETGRVRAHGRDGFAAGCRCGTCEAAGAPVLEAQREARRAAAVAREAWLADAVAGMVGESVAS